jgi:sugar phosphate isomerase/epimerase
MRWLLGATAELARELALHDQADHWERVLAEMPDLSLGTDGRLLVAPEAPLREAHRHFSHLMAIHPLGLIDRADGPEARRVIEASLQDLDRLGTANWCGYSFAWLANIAARAGDGTKAERALEIFATAFTLRNSFHCNGDQSGKGYSNFRYRPFTLEGNFAAAAGTQEMLLQSHGNRIEIFPAIPESWQDVSFKKLRAQGAFLVSAERVNGSTRRLEIEAEKGGRCRVLSPFSGQEFVLSMTEGEKVVLTRDPDPTRDIAGLLSCSTLCQARQSTAQAFTVIAGMGYEWIDLSCLNWAPHVSVPDLMEDFDKEANRLESLLKKHGLRVSNLTFDGMASRPFPRYEKAFSAVVKLAVRLNARLINLMAPAAGSDRAEQVEKLKTLYAMARESGVKLTLETHKDQITERPADALWLCRQVPGLGLTLDPSHYYAGPHQGGSYHELLPFVQGTGFRAGGMSWDQIQLPWGQGPIDFSALIKSLETQGYQGFYVTEYIEGFNDIDAVQQSKRFLEWGQNLSGIEPTQE